MRGNNIGLALQGGGSYAAFTSGVLKALLNRRRRFLAPDDILSVSGTSGGALNAALLGRALHEKRPNPLVYVDRLWQLNRLERHLKKNFRALGLVPDEVLARLIGMGRNLLEAQPHLAGGGSAKLKAAAMSCMEEMVHAAVPGLPADPLEPLLPARRPYVTVAATEVRTATAHYFTNNRRMIRKFERLEIAKHRRLIRPLGLAGVYASLAHPLVFNPVRIDEDMYWDGYYTCNPPFVYLFREGCDEVVLVRLVQQTRESVGESAAAVKDRIEEIIQNTTINMEILAYLAMREVLLGSRLAEGAELKLAMKKLSPAAVYHEIRLLKPGNIADEGYPLSEFIEKLIRMGRKVVEDKEGFISTYRKSGKGLQVVSEIRFETEEVRSYVVDLDKLLFDESPQATPAPAEAAPSSFLRFFRALFD